jgi:hypothetical protein
MKSAEVGISSSITGVTETSPIFQPVALGPMWSSFSSGGCYPNPGERRASIWGAGTPSLRTAGQATVWHLPACKCPISLRKQRIACGSLDRCVPILSGAGIASRVRPPV